MSNTRIPRFLTASSEFWTVFVQNHSPLHVPRPLLARRPCEDHCGRRWVLPILFTTVFNVVWLYVVHSRANVNKKLIVGSNKVRTQATLMQTASTMAVHTVLACAVSVCTCLTLEVYVHFLDETWSWSCCSLYEDHCGCHHRYSWRASQLPHLNFCVMSLFVYKKSKTNINVCELVPSNTIRTFLSCTIHNHAPLNLIRTCSLSSPHCCHRVRFILWRVSHRTCEVLFL